jgi:hypothetical protein
MALFTEKQDVSRNPFIADKPWFAHATNFPIMPRSLFVKTNRSKEKSSLIESTL